MWWSSYTTPGDAASLRSARTGRAESVSAELRLDGDERVIEVAGAELRLLALADVALKLVEVLNEVWSDSLTQPLSRCRKNQQLRAPRGPCSGAGRPASRDQGAIDRRYVSLGRWTVDAAELKNLQGPLKDRYRDDPSSAVVTLKAEGRLGSEDVSCSVATGRAMVEAGLHPATGGDGGLACSGDMLLQALVACAGVTLRSVVTNRGLDVQGSVRAEGDLDFRGTLGVDREAPVGFTDIRLTFDLTSPASPE